MPVLTLGRRVLIRPWSQSLVSIASADRALDSCQLQLLCLVRDAANRPGQRRARPRGVRMRVHGCAGAAAGGRHLDQAADGGCPKGARGHNQDRRPAVCIRRRTGRITPIRNVYRFSKLLSLDTDLLFWATGEFPVVQAPTPRPSDPRLVSTAAVPRMAACGWLVRCLASNTSSARVAR